MKIPKSLLILKTRSTELYFVILVFNKRPDVYAIDGNGLSSISIIIHRAVSPNLGVLIHKPIFFLYTRKRIDFEMACYYY